MALFVTGSSTRLAATAAITGTPMTAAGWLKPRTISQDQNWYAVTASANSTNYMACYIASGNAFGAESGSFNGAEAGTAVVNAWHFVLCRFIGSTNRRISVLLPDGSTAHAQNTGTGATTGLNQQDLGCFRGNSANSFFDGDIAEWWTCNSDIVEGNGQTSDQLLRKLAYEGPFSIARVAAVLVEYRRLSVTLGSDTDKMGECYWGMGGFGRTIWTNTNGVTIGHRPPLSPLYKRPAQYTELMLV